MACSRMPKCRLRPPERAGFEIAGAFECQTCLGRGREIGRAADQPGMMRRDGVEHLAGGFAGGDALGVGGKGRQLCIPARRAARARCMRSIWSARSGCLLR